MAEEAKQCVQKERDASKNSVHASLNIDLNPTFTRKGWMLYFCGEPTRLAHGLQAKHNKDFETSIEYWCSMACGGGIDTLVSTFQLLNDRAKLQRMDFVLTVGDLGHKSAFDEVCSQAAFFRTQ
jgi:hypothetical protein